MSPLSLRVRNDGVGVLLYDRPGASDNVLLPGFAATFERAFDAIEEDRRIVAAVLLSGKPSTFIAGASPEMVGMLRDSAVAETLSHEGHAMLRRLEGLRVPLVAGIRGGTFGGGFEIALACHGRIAVDDASTIMALPEVRMGLCPGMSGVQRLARCAGLKAAFDYALTGKGIRPADALRLGVVTALVSAGELEDAAARLALTLAECPVPTVAPQSHKWAGALDAKRDALCDADASSLLPAQLSILEILDVYAASGFEASERTEAHLFGQLGASMERT
jgi:3-hydroxyacyl-CoA dehydrogenase/enoyl-CoA hydratase/3-hydroxybutyryl-CoA epimerase